MASRLARLVFCAATLFAASPALASNPHAIYVVPTRVDFFPDEANATKVMIHGAFFFWQTGFTYGSPSCGYMYFSCPSGSESMCRMQWEEIKAGIGGTTCEGFGPQSVMTKATLYMEGTAPGSPDAWDLGIGVSQGSWVDGKCDAAKALKCSLPSPPDLATSPADLSVASKPDLSTPPDLSVAAKADLSTVPPAPDLAMASAPDLSVAVSPDLAMTQTVSTATCALGGRGSSATLAGSMAALVAGAALLLSVRRRRSKAR